MDMVYVILGHSTGCNGGVIHWADSAYFDKEEAYDQCNKMNNSITDDKNYLAYVVGPISLN